MLTGKFFQRNGRFFYVSNGVLFIHEEEGWRVVSSRNERPKFVPLKQTEETIQKQTKISNFFDELLLD